MSTAGFHSSSSAQRSAQSLTAQTAPTCVVALNHSKQLITCPPRSTAHATSSSSASSSSASIQFDEALRSHCIGIPSVRSGRELHAFCDLTGVIYLPPDHADWSNHQNMGSSTEFPSVRRDPRIPPSSHCNGLSESRRPINQPKHISGLLNTSKHFSRDLISILREIPIAWMCFRYLQIFSRHGNVLK